MDLTNGASLDLEYEEWSNLAEFAWEVFQVVTKVYCFDSQHWALCSVLSAARDNWTSVRFERTTWNLLCNVSLSCFVFVHCCVTCPTNCRLLFFWWPDSRTCARNIKRTMKYFPSARPTDELHLNVWSRFVRIWNNPQWSRVTMADLRSRLGKLGVECCNTAISRLYLHCRKEVCHSTVKRITNDARLWRNGVKHRKTTKILRIRTYNGHQRRMKIYVSSTMSVQILRHCECRNWINFGLHRERTIGIET